MGLEETKSYKLTSLDYNISEIGQSMPLAKIGTYSKHVPARSRPATIQSETCNY